uniref:Putative secreted protein n=1 Tax=Anopheles marajoara TaxID=58244 RepID=A0A2M4C7K3_9DIPT
MLSPSRDARFGGWWVLLSECSTAARYAPVTCWYSMRMDTLACRCSRCTGSCCSSVFSLSLYLSNISTFNMSPVKFNLVHHMMLYDGYVALDNQKDILALAHRAMCIKWHPAFFCR